MTEIFKDNTIAQPCRVSAICSLWKFYECLLHQIGGESMLLFVNHLHGKISMES